MHARHRVVMSAVGAAALMLGCAPARTAPALPSVLAHPEFVYPAVPPALASDETTGRIDQGWRYLQNGDLVNADLEFLGVLRDAPAFHPAQVGAAWVALARGDRDRALAGFDDALRVAPGYIPALVGRGRTLLLLERNAAALAAFEAALAVDESLAEVRRTVDVLRFQALQDAIESARTAAAANQVEEARAAYGRAIDTSPESAFLYRELGLLERAAGNTQAALDRFRRAVELDPADLISLVQIGELLELQLDYEGAAAAYQRAANLDPSGELNARVTAMTDRSRESRLPAEFRAIASAAEITRGDLAALIGVQLGEALRAAPVKEVVMTDTQGHWAATWMAQMARAGILDPFANHAFEPDARVTRVDLATAASRVVAVLAADRPALRPHLAARPSIADMAAGHVSYPAVSVAVASGATPLVDGGRFQATRLVSGVEAVEVVARLQALARTTR